MKKHKTTILILDDEPHCLDWLIDYLESKSYLLEVVTNVKDAFDHLQTSKYRAVIVDLNVPSSGEFHKMLLDRGEIFLRFPGLFIAAIARDLGHRDRQVIVYSVHESEAAEAECKKLGVTYLTKGRPRQFKVEIDSVLGYDPTDE